MNLPADRRSPSPMTQAAVTVALVVYLVGLGLSIAGNTGSGSSALVRTIKGRLFAPWMVPPWLDLGFDYRLTYGGEEDGRYGLEVRRQDDAKSPMVQLPGRLDGERAARWRRLARAIALEDADRDGLLAAAVGRGMFDDLKTEDVTVRVLRTPLIDRGGPSTTPVQATAVRVRMKGGDLQLLRAEPRGEVAPLVQPEAAVRPADAGGTAAESPR